MEVPVIIKIGYVHYPVVWLDQEDCGTCNAELGIITISNHLPLEQQAATLLHELMHAVWADRTMPAKADEEAAVDGLSRGLATAFVDNPELLDWLGDALNGE